jgi:hypothetical protein
MSGEPIKNIIRILYDDLTSAVFSIIKTYQKRLRNELEAKLKENGYEITNLDNSLGQLKNIGIIKIEDKPTQPQIKGGRKMLKQSMVKLYKYNGVDINSLKNKYEQMKKNMRNDLDERVKKNIYVKNVVFKEMTIWQVEQNFNVKSVKYLIARMKKIYLI